ncbi:uncharacterized protein VTP21DRAFT_11750 [Calcarisporiella thermophila]|uniref:uncharacterized protein n=1 Tax=Calcarisporiella thermophila TaxID=911321 RepID=UPI003742C423
MISYANVAKKRTGQTSLQHDPPIKPIFEGLVEFRRHSVRAGRLILWGRSNGFPHLFFTDGPLPVFHGRQGIEFCLHN